MTEKNPATDRLHQDQPIRLAGEPLGTCPRGIAQAGFRAIADMVAESVLAMRLVWV